MANVGFLLIHGAGLGAWIWREVTPQLNVPFKAVDFPYRDGTSQQRQALSFDDYVGSVMNQAAELKTEKIVIVAHSLGGAVALKVASLLGDRLAGFIAVGAAIPKNGGSYMSSLPFPQRFIVAGIMKFAGTQPPASAIRNGLCNDVPEALADEVVRTFAAESRAAYTSATGAGSPMVPKMYVLLTSDKEFGPALERTMAANLGGDVVELNAGHMPMLSKPAELAEILSNFAAKLQKA